jgi:hypothetical protein
VSTLRLYETGLDAEEGTRLRVYEVGLDVAIPVQPVLRLYDVGLAVVGAVTVELPAAATIGPGEILELEAELVTGGSASWSWRRISGPALTIAADGGSATITGPSRWNADIEKPTAGIPGVSTVVVGVTATVDGITSPEARCTVTVLPQLSWSRSGSTWVGSRVAPA